MARTPCRLAGFVLAAVAVLTVLPSLHAAPATSMPRTPTCGNVQPDEQLPQVTFDCEAFSNPDTRCSNIPGSSDLPPTFVGCCECTTSTEVPVELAVTITDATKVSGQPGQPTNGVGDVLEYTISVAAQTCLPGNELKDVLLTNQLPAGQFQVASQGIKVEPNEAVCSVDENSRLTCTWSSIPCLTTKQVTITGTVTKAGRLTHCVTATTSSGDLGDLPNEACAKPVLVAPRVLGSCCTRTGECITRTSKVACRNSLLQGGVAGQAWYSGRATCPKSCRPAKKAAVAATAGQPKAVADVVEGRHHRHRA